MDFASALEDLERTADAASSGRGGGGSHHYNSRGGGGGGRRRGRPEDQYGGHHNRRNQRPRHHHHSSRGGGGGYSSDRGRGGRGRHHSHHRGGPPSGHHHHPLEDMRRFGYRIEEPAFTPKPNLGQPNHRPFHIALLAICIDGLPFEHLWRAWAADNSNCNTRVSLLVHAKYPHKVESDFLKQRIWVRPPKLGRGNSYADPEFVSHQPNWGSVQITRAMIDLLRDALVMGTHADNEKDARFAKKRYQMEEEGATDSTTLPPVDKFIFISETCVPVASLAEFEQALFGSPALYVTPSDPAATTPEITPWHMSWVNARNRNTPGTPRNKYERDQFGEIFRMVPGQYRWKADQWMALSRPHATAVAGMDGHMRVGDQLWNSFTKISASDEMYFPTCLGVLQIIQDPKVVMRLKEQQQQQNSGPSSGEREDSKDVAEKPKDESPPEEATKEDGEDGDKTKEKPEEEAAGDRAAAADKTPGPTVESLSPTVLFKPITYTDWSEGMRNPKSFFSGASDLRTIGRLAREQGSLVARKFILSPPSEDSTGKAAENLSGYISVDEWKQMLEEAVPLGDTPSSAAATETS